ncbi:MAG: hypothetical protein JWR50_1513, partial [Mucilaginibacter sp.]|nr:hypothetical protein [Mucilaginibacter sp.]
YRDTEFPEEEINNKLSDLWAKIKTTEETQTTEEPEQGPKKIILWKWLSAVAAILVFALAVLVFVKSHQTADVESKAVVTRKIDVPYGKTDQVKLPDGTLVKLNAGSHFSYPSVFSSTQREVTLDGEGFFEVTKNPKRPFLVHTSGLTVRVLGTVFNVKAYHNDHKIETTLLKGKVQVELTNDPERKIILSPLEKLTVNNQLIVVNNTRGKAGITKVKYEVDALPESIGDVYPENAWTDNKIMFANSDFEDVARQMERRYDVQIIFKDEALKKEQISGVLENENLDAALQILKQIVAFKSTVDGNIVYLSRRRK